MNEAIELFYQIYRMFLGLIFDDFTIADNVSVGWIIVAAFVGIMLVRSILNLPRGAARTRLPGSKEDLHG